MEWAEGTSLKSKEGMTNDKIVANVELSLTRWPLVYEINPEYYGEYRVHIGDEVIRYKLTKGMVKLQVFSDRSALHLNEAGKLTIDETNLRRNNGAFTTTSEAADASTNRR